MTKQTTKKKNLEADWMCTYCKRHDLREDQVVRCQHMNGWWNTLCEACFRTERVNDWEQLIWVTKKGTELHNVWSKEERREMNEVFMAYLDGTDKTNKKAEADLKKFIKMMNRKYENT